MRNRIPLMLAGNLATAFVLGVFSGGTASAQTVQLPVFEQIGVQTQVLVPDRGGVYLGGVKRLREGAGFSTPFGLGSSIGREVSNTGISAHVYISDLHEMDDLILNSPDHGYSFGVRFVDPGPYGSRFSDFSLQRSPRYVESIGRVSIRPMNRSDVSTLPPHNSLGRSGFSSRTPQVPKPLKQEKISLDAGRSFRLGQQAEADGKEGLAILHYRTATQLGSVVARDRLAALGDTLKVKALASR